MFKHFPKLFAFSSIFLAANFSFAFYHCENEGGDILFIYNSLKFNSAKFRYVPKDSSNVDELINSSINYPFRAEIQNGVSYLAANFATPSGSFSIRAEAPSELDLSCAMVSDEFGQPQILPPRPHCENRPQKHGEMTIFPNSENMNSMTHMEFSCFYIP